MNNTVIKVLNREHGKQVIQWWKDQGIDTKNYIGNYTEVNRDAFCYYGVINDKFDNYHFSDVTSNNATIIELPTSKEDDLLAEVRRRYPIGTKFCPGHIMPGTEYCIVTNANFKIEENYIYSLTDEAQVHADSDNIKYGNTHFNRVVRNNKGEWATIIETPLSLLDQAKAKYPVGTRYITASNDWNAEHIVTEQSFSLPSEDKVYAEDGKGCLYINGEWAKILSSIKTEDILEKARRLYPIGTRFKCVKDGEEGVSITEVEVYDDDELFSRFAGRVCNQYVYGNGKWAEIVTTPKEEPSKFVTGKWYKLTAGRLSLDTPWFVKFKEINESGIYRSSEHISEYNGYETTCASFGKVGDYTFTLLTDLSEIQQSLPDGHPDKFPAQNYDSITFKQIPSIEKWSVDSYVVFLEDYGGHSKGTVSKIIKNSSKHNVQVEHLYNSMPGNGCNLSKDRECKWFATKKEAEKFAATLKEPVKEDLVGRYIKALVDRPNSGDVKQGEIGIIIRLFNDELVTVNFPSQSWYSANCKNGKYELMPKDYQPHVEKPIETSTESMVGRWVKVIKNSTSEGHPIGIYLQIKTEMNSLDCFWVYGFDRCLHTSEVEIMPKGFTPLAIPVEIWSGTVSTSPEPPTEMSIITQWLLGHPDCSSKDSIGRIKVKKRAVKKISVL